MDPPLGLRPRLVLSLYLVIDRQAGVPKIQIQLLLTLLLGIRLAVGRLVDAKPTLEQPRGRQGYKPWNAGGITRCSLFLGDCSFGAVS